MRAAHYRHQSGDYYDTDEVQAARKAADDLAARTWHQDRSMTRDEKRLYAKYHATIEADQVKWFERWNAHDAATKAELAERTTQARAALQQLLKEQSHDIH